jgi:hypothetical protein
MGFLFWGGWGQKETEMNIEDAATEVLVNQLAIARQSIEDRDRRIWELERRAELLEGMLNRLAARLNGVPAPQPQPTSKALPKRWAVR